MYQKAHIKVLIEVLSIAVCFSSSNGDDHRPITDRQSPLDVFTGFED